MSTPHNSATPGDFAKTVLMPGDPLRAQFIAENFPDGYTMSVDWESYKEFDTNPAFGKACKTHKVTFITES